MPDNNKQTPPPKSERTIEERVEELETELKAEAEVRKGHAKHLEQLVGRMLRYEEAESARGIAVAAMNRTIDKLQEKVARNERVDIALDRDNYKMLLKLERKATEDRHTFAKHIGTVEARTEDHEKAIHRIAEIIKEIFDDGGQHYDWIMGDINHEKYMAEYLSNERTSRHLQDESIRIRIEEMWKDCPLSKVPLIPPIEPDDNKRAPGKEPDLERLAEVAHHAHYPGIRWDGYTCEEWREGIRRSVRAILKELGHEGEGGPVIDTSRCLCPKCGCLSIFGKGCPYCGCTLTEWNLLKVQGHLDEFNRLWPYLRDEYTLCIIENKVLWPPSEPDNKDSKHQAKERELEELAEHLYCEHAEGLGLALDDIHPFQGLISQQRDAWLAVARAVLEDRG